MLYLLAQNIVKSILVIWKGLWEYLDKNHLILSEKMINLVSE